MSLTFTFELLHIENRRSNNPPKIKFRRDAVGGVHWERKGAIDPAVKKEKKNGRTIGQK